MRIHYRHDGRPRRTLCGLRIATDHKPRYRKGAPIATTDRTPRVLDRATSCVLPISIDAARVLDILGADHDCPFCLAVANTLIESGRERGKEKPRWQADEQTLPWWNPDDSVVL